ncbi:MAG: hypothetical protein HZA46_09510 [Planctomycetales bacterium]|nr:hypothetical protein [Planctomycetales bacterium]
MTKISKILTVLVFFACLSFMGFAMVTVLGGPNWQNKSEALAAEHSFSYEYRGKESGWDVKDHRKGTPEQVASGKSLAEAVVKSQRKLIENQKSELDAISKETDSVAQIHTRQQAAITADQAAFKQRVDVLEQQLKAVRVEAVEESKKAVTKSDEAKAIRQVAALRRDELIQLQNQLVVLRTQKSSALADQKRLEDLLNQAQAVLADMERRKELLESDGAKADANYDK